MADGCWRCGIGKADPDSHAGSGPLRERFQNGRVVSEQEPRISKNASFAPGRAEQAQPHLGRDPVAVGIDRYHLAGPGSGGWQLRPQVGFVHADEEGEGPAVPQGGNPALQPAPYCLGIDLKPRGDILVADRARSSARLRASFTGSVPPNPPGLRL